MSFERPNLEQLDVTPGVDENALAEFDAAPLLAPRHLPERWVLLGAADSGFPLENLPLQSDVVPPEVLEQFRPCPSVSLQYRVPTADYFLEESKEKDGFVIPAHLSLTESASSCREPQSPFGGGPFPGPMLESLVGGIAGGDSSSVTVTVGATRIQAESSLPEAEVRRILADLVPFDLATQPVERSVPREG